METWRGLGLGTGADGLVFSGALEELTDGTDGRFTSGGSTIYVLRVRDGTLTGTTRRSDSDVSKQVCTIHA
jgi:hypothetical protein